MSAARAHRHTSSSTKARANQQLVRRALELKVCLAGCVMTPGNDTLLCRCGKHSATFREGKKNQKAHWSIWIQEEGPNKPRRLSTRSEKQKAWEAVSALCYGSTRPRSREQQHLQSKTLTAPCATLSASITTTLSAEHLVVVALVRAADYSY